MPASASKVAFSGRYRDGGNRHQKHASETSLPEAGITEVLGHVLRDTPRD